MTSNSVVLAAAILHAVFLSDPQGPPLVLTFRICSNRHDIISIPFTAVRNVDHTSNHQISPYLMVARLIQNSLFRGAECGSYTASRSTDNSRNTPQIGHYAVGHLVNLPDGRLMRDSSNRCSNDKPRHATQQ